MFLCFYIAFFPLLIPYPVDSSTSSVYCKINERVSQIKPVLRQQRESKWFSDCGWRGSVQWFDIPVLQYEHYSVDTTVYECCPGYKKVSGGCQPQCNKCDGGTCIGPNDCKCPLGYFLSNDSNCLPFCSEGCLNADCIKPEICKCKSGYTTKNNFTNVCEPSCSSNCINSQCSEPEVCKCYPGYRKNKTNKYICDPVCKEPCENATCVAPDVCACETGYERYSRWKCRPACFLGCNGKGHCVEPGYCNCTDGYEPPNCTPICSEGCTNGNCIAPEQCVCGSGHTYSDGACTPVCEIPCQNGFCISPNECECNPGYNKDNTTDTECIPLCNQPCENGYCTSPDFCTCYEGYQHHPSSSTQCLPHLGHTLLLSSPYMNKYIFKDIVTFNSSKNTFTVFSFPEVEIPRSCKSLEEILNVTFSADVTNDRKIFCFNCEGGYDSIENNLIITCEYNNETCTEVIENEYNVTSLTTDTGNKTDLVLNLIFPQIFGTAEQGGCVLNLQQRDRIFSDSESMTLMFYSSSRVPENTIRFNDSREKVGSISTSLRVFILFFTIAILIVIITVTITPRLRMHFLEIFHFSGQYEVREPNLANLRELEK